MIFNWITNGTDKPFYARCERKVEKAVSKATAYVCGLGQFNFYINGAKISDHILDPGWTKYDKYIQYVTFDVTENVKCGVNAIAAEVGNGWYIKDDEGGYTFHFPEFMPPNPNPYKPFGKALVLAVNLVIEYEDGTSDTFGTDESWKVSSHMIQSSNVYGSEVIDGRLRQIGWNTTSFDDSVWESAYVLSSDEAPKGEMVEQFQPAIKIVKTYEGVYLGNVNQRKIYDLSQNMSGMLSLEIKGKAGTKVEIRTAEKLDENGDVDQMAKNWLLIDNCCTYIIAKDDEWEPFEQVFTYFAGRFVSVEVVCSETSQEGSDEVEIRNVRGNYITSAWEDAGSFECDDERLNQIYHLVKSSVEANMVSVHTDCPTIERFAWQEPNHLMAPSIMYMKNGRLLWEKFLCDMRAEQHTASDSFLDFAGNEVIPGDGLVPSQAPCYIPNVLPVPGMGSFYDIIPWGSSCILGTFWHYHFYGDKSIVEQNYEMGKRYLSHLKTKLTPEGFINHGLGDWGNPDNQLARENVETVFLYADTIVLAEFAKLLGLTEDQADMLSFAEWIKKNYNEKLLVQHPTEGFWCYRNYENADKIELTQACEAMPLYWGLVPEDKKSDVEKAFTYVMERDQAIRSGEVGQPYIIQTMRALGMNDTICKFILKEEHPSYYAFVLDGETSLGEYWETNPRSHNHDMMGHIVEWYYNGLAGIELMTPGGKEVRIRPYLPDSVHWLKCTYQTAYGEVSVELQEKEDCIDVCIQCANEVQVAFDDSLLAKKGKQIHKLM